MKMTLAITTVLCAAAVSTVAVAAKPTTRNRAEIPAEFRWDFSAIYPNWDAWEAGMKDMDAKMDAFAALKGTLASGRRGAAAQGLPGLRRDRQAPVPHSTAIRSCSATSTPATRPWPGASSGSAPPSPSSTPPPPGSRPSCWPSRRRRSPAGSRRRRRSRPTASPILDNYRQKAHVLDDKGERLLSLAGQFNTAPKSIYSELAHLRHQVPDDQALRRQGGRAEPGQLRRAARDQPEPGRPRPGGGGARRHLRRHRQHLRRDLQRRAAARLVPRPGAQLPDHARRRARRQRDPARRWSRR